MTAMIMEMWPLGVACQSQNSPRSPELQDHGTLFIACMHRIT